MPTWLTEFLKWLGEASEFWSAIAGAVVGGIFSLFLQLIATKSARTERLEERKQYQKSLGNGLVWKMIHIHSDFHDISQHIEDSYRAVPERDHYSPSQFVQQLAVYPLPIEFSTEEMALVLTLKSDDLLNDMLVTPKRHRTIIESIKRYDEWRTNVGDQLVPTSSEGAKAVIDDKEQMAKHAHKIAGLDNLIREIRELALRYTADAKALLTLLQKRLVEEGVIKGELEFGFDAGPAQGGKPE